MIAVYVLVELITKNYLNLARITESKKAVLESGLAAPGDRVVIVAGVPVDAPGTTNMIKADLL